MIDLLDDSPSSIGRDMEFDMPVPLRKTQRTEARIVMTPHWPVTHRDFPGYSISVHASFQYQDEWVLSEKTTGQSIAIGSSIDGVLELALHKLKDVTPEKMAAAVERGHKAIAEMMSKPEDNAK